MTFYQSALKLLPLNTFSSSRHSRLPEKATRLSCIHSHILYPERLPGVINYTRWETTIFTSLTSAMSNISPTSDVDGNSGHKADANTSPQPNRRQDLRRMLALCIMHQIGLCRIALRYAVVGWTGTLERVSRSTQRMRGSEEREKRGEEKIDMGR